MLEVKEFPNLRKMYVETDNPKERQEVLNLVSWLKSLIGNEVEFELHDLKTQDNKDLFVLVVKARSNFPRVRTLVNFFVDWNNYRKGETFPEEQIKKLK